MRKVRLFLVALATLGFTSFYACGGAKTEEAPAADEPAVEEEAPAVEEADEAPVEDAVDEVDEDGAVG